MKNIPIILVHKGDSFYLAPVLKQIRLFNPEARICLISDTSTAHYDFVEHYDIEQYSKSLGEFAKVYIHMSVNPYNYELFCFQRWFVIRDFVYSQQIMNFVCLDSDVLLYCNVDEIFNKYITFDFTICKVMGPCFSLFNCESIGKLCDYMMFLYTDKEAFRRLKDFYRTVVDGGVCDMTALTWYQKDISNNVIDLIYPDNDNICFDGNISDSMGFEMEHGRKKIYWIENLPYGKFIENDTLIRFAGLHLQGGAKHSLYKYLLNSQKIHNVSFLYILKWKFSFKRLYTRYREMKKILSSYTLFRMVILRKISLFK